MLILRYTKNHVTPSELTVQSVSFIFSPFRWPVLLHKAARFVTLLLTPVKPLRQNLSPPWISRLLSPFWALISLLAPFLCECLEQKERCVILLIKISPMKQEKYILLDTIYSRCNQQISGTVDVKNAVLSHTAACRMYCYCIYVCWNKCIQAQGHCFEGNKTN